MVALPSQEYRWDRGLNIYLFFARFFARFVYIENEDSHHNMYCINHRNSLWLVALPRNQLKWNYKPLKIDQFLGANHIFHIMTDVVQPANHSLPSLYHLILHQRREIWPRRAATSQSASRSPHVINQLTNHSPFYLLS